MNETPPDPSEIPSSIPVSVLVECRQGRSGQWVVDQWEAIAVVAGEGVGAGESKTTLVHEDAGSRRYLWSGLRLELYRDACEAYWYNLMSGRPYLYVVCNMVMDEDGGESPVPVLVTADQQEASGHMETDDWVNSVPMPEQVHDWVERFVVAHYVPAQKKKRKRQNWAKTSENHGETTEHRGTRPVRH